jgi:hypothetical protein
MAKKTIDKDTKDTKAKKVDVADPVSEQKEDKIVNPEKDLEEKKDVSEVVTPENTSENPEKVEAEQESLNAEEKPAQPLNETVVMNGDPAVQTPLNEVVTPETTEEKVNEEFSGQVDGPIVEGDLSEVIDHTVVRIDPSQFAHSSRSSKPATSYDAAAPTAFYVEDDTTPSYNAQCPPKPKTEREGAYIAQRPY